MIGLFNDRKNTVSGLTLSFIHIVYLGARRLTYKQTANLSKSNM